MGKNQIELNAALEAAKAEGLEEADLILNGFGIEHVVCGDRELVYVNLGDTYDTTICQEKDDEPFISSWGAWYEETEAEICEEEGVIRCSYCGEFTEHPDGVIWSDVVCKHCGHCVAG